LSQKAETCTSEIGVAFRSAYTGKLPLSTARTGWPFYPELLLLLKKFQPVFLELNS
jgi:hypothetical protein